MSNRYPMTTRITVDGRRIYVTPVKYFDEVLPGYFMDKNGDVYSTRSWRGSNENRKLTVSCTPGSYPSVRVFDKNGKGVRCRLHRLVAHTLIPFEKPREISNEEWNYICKNMPGTMRYIWEHNQVNHIDEDRTNYHPSNLEWMSGTDNRNTYHKNYARAMQNFVSECGLEIDFKMSKTLRKAA